MSAADLELQLAPHVAIRGWIRALLWLMVFLMLLSAGFVSAERAGAAVGLVLGVVLMAITERHWRAVDGSPPLRLCG